MSQIDVIETIAGWWFSKWSFCRSVEWIDDETDLYDGLPLFKVSTCYWWPTSETLCRIIKWLRSILTNGYMMTIRGVYESSGGSGMTVDDFENWSLQQQESNWIITPREKQSFHSNWIHSCLAFKIPLECVRAQLQVQLENFRRLNLYGNVVLFWHCGESRQSGGQCLQFIDFTSARIVPRGRAKGRQLSKYGCTDGKITWHHLIGLLSTSTCHVWFPCKFTYNKHYSMFTCWVCRGEVSLKQLHGLGAYISIVVDGKQFGQTWFEF